MRSLMGAGGEKEVAGVGASTNCRYQLTSALSLTPSTNTYAHVSHFERRPASAPVKGRSSYGEQ
jgi:hypothetical protein